MGTRNPYVGSHPDLLPLEDRYPARPPGAAPLSPGDRKRLAATEAGLTPVHVPLESLTHDQIIHTPRSHFSDDEWNTLDDDDQEDVLDNDPESQARIQPLVELFVDRARYAASVDDLDSEDLNNVMETFEQWLAPAARAQKLWEMVPRNLHRRMVARAEELGLDETDVDAILNEVLADNNFYEVGTKNVAASWGHPVWSRDHRADFYIESSNWEEMLETAGGNQLLYPDEIQRAIDQINKANDNLEIPDDMFQHRSSRRGRARGQDGAPWNYWKRDNYERQWDTGESVPVYCRWNDVAESVDEHLNERASDKPASGYQALVDAAPEERVVHRWPDGFYVQDLLAEELPDEGRIQSMCVGRAEFGYAKALTKGEIKILSLRRPSGKPLFTFEVTLNDAGKIDGVNQIKGKANRLPGFDLGKDDARYPIKRDEVAKVYQFIEGPMVPMVDEEGTGGIGVDDIEDLREAAGQVRQLWAAGDPWARKLLADLGIDYEELGGAVRRPVPRENPRSRSCGLHGSLCTGFCQPYRRRRPTTNPGERSKLDEALERRRLQGLGTAQPQPRDRSVETQRLASDRAGAKTWAERLAAILVKHGLPARSWQPATGGVTRVYIGSQYLTVSYDGDPSGTLRGYATFREEVLYPKQRAAYRAAMDEYRRAREDPR